jgi:hypothetical protein
MVPHFTDETYEDVKTPGYNVLGHIIRGLNIRGHNVQGSMVPVPGKNALSQVYEQTSGKCF